MRLNRKLRNTLIEEAGDSAIQNGLDTAREMGKPQDWETIREFSLSSVVDGIESTAMNHGMDFIELEKLISDEVTDYVKRNT